MLFDIIRSGGDKLEVIIGLCVSIFVVFCTMPIHEYAHAFVATKLGDNTPRLQGRLTLNPLAHIDIMGALMILIVGFGYAKPVSVNPRNFKNPKGGMALTALAGPVSNLIMAFVFCILSVFTMRVNSAATIVSVAKFFFYYAASINVGLAIFNLIPIPPLDGSRIINLIIPEKYYFKIMKYERYIIIGVFALIFFGVLDLPLSAASGAVLRLFMNIASKIVFLG